MEAISYTLLSLRPLTAHFNQCNNARHSTMPVPTVPRPLPRRSTPHTVMQCSSACPSKEKTVYTSPCSSNRKARKYVQEPRRWHESTTESGCWTRYGSPCSTSSYCSLLLPQRLQSGSRGLAWLLPFLPDVRPVIPLFLCAPSDSILLYNHHSAMATMPVSRNPTTVSSTQFLPIQKISLASLPCQLLPR